MAHQELEEQFVAPQRSTLGHLEHVLLPFSQIVRLIYMRPVAPPHVRAYHTSLNGCSSGGTLKVTTMRDHWLKRGSHYDSTPDTWLVYDRFPGDSLPSKVKIIHEEQVLHEERTEKHTMKLRMFILNVNILSHDVPCRPIAVVQVPIRFWVYVLVGRARSELLVIRRPVGQT